MSGGSAVPAVIVVNTTSTQESLPRVIVVNRSAYRAQFSLFGFLLTLAICYGAYYYATHLRNNIASTINAAERSAERASEHGEHKKK